VDNRVMDIKMKGIRIFLAVIYILLVSNFAFGIADFNSGSELHGFRGIKWGTDIKTLYDMRYNGGDGEIRIYGRANDIMSIDGVELEKIPLYKFWKGKFYEVVIMTAGYANWVSLKESVFGHFGEGHQEDKSIEEYLWLGKISEASLEYDEATEKGIFVITSTEINKQEESYEKQNGNFFSGLFGPIIFVFNAAKILFAPTYVGSSLIDSLVESTWGRGTFSYKLGFVCGVLLILFIPPIIPVFLRKSNK